jgi:hypothetical protein
MGIKGTLHRQVEGHVSIFSSSALRPQATRDKGTMNITAVSVYITRKCWLVAWMDGWLVGW